VISLETDMIMVTEPDFEKRGPLPASSSHLYKGVLTDDLRVELLEIFISSVNDAFDGLVNPKPLANILVELLDNAQRYSSDTRIRLAWWLENGNFFCQLKNKAQTAHALKLQSEVKRLNKLSHEEIISEYRVLLQNQTFSKEGGAGLGLVQIIRAGAKIWPVRVDIDSNGLAICTYTIQTTIKKQ